MNWSLVLFLLLPIYGISQHTDTAIVYITVVEYPSGKPIPLAAIVFDSGTTLHTDIDGKAWVCLPKSTYAVKITAFPYFARHTNFVLTGEPNITFYMVWDYQRALLCTLPNAR